MSEADEAPKLEARLKRLEEILTRIEADDLDLGEALTLFEEGVNHVRASEEILSAAELRVEEVLGNGDTQPLDGGEEDEA